MSMLTARSGRRAETRNGAPSGSTRDRPHSHEERNYRRFRPDRRRRMRSRVDAGELKIEVVERRPLAELAAVHDQAAAGRLSGKTVLTPA